MSFYIRKFSGEKQRFDLNKFRRSLFKAGASDQIANIIIDHVLQVRPKTTKELHKIATQLLQKYARPIADRYNLKRALIDFGPHGFPFEKFIAHIFSVQGYSVKTDVIIPGFCVDHEIDIVAIKDHDHSIIECKFHNRLGTKSDIKVALYVQARFEDILNVWQKDPAHHKEFHKIWLVTNTKLTTEAIKYGECKKIVMIGWDYPEKNNLPQLIHQYKLFPITTLTSLNKYQKRLFLQHGFVLCKDSREQQATLEKLGLKPDEIAKIIREAEDVCAL